MVVDGVGHSGGRGGKEVGVWQCGENCGTRMPPFYTIGVGGEAAADGIMVAMKWTFIAIYGFEGMRWGGAMVTGGEETS
jgi:hypothetical protein